MNRLAWKVLDFILGAIIVAHAAVCMIFRNKICVFLATLAAFFAGALLAAVLGDILVMYGLTGVLCLTVGILKKLALASLLVSASVIFLAGYGRAKHAEGYDAAKKIYDRW